MGGTKHPIRFWVAPSSGAKIQVIDPGTEEPYFSVAEAQAADIARAVGAARDAFDTGPWPRLTHAQRAGYLRALSAEVKKTAEDVAQIWPREADVERAREVAGQIRAGTVGHNGFKSDSTIGFGGYKQSGIGREGGVQGLQPFLETKTVLLDGPPARYCDTSPG